jgi:hypothetical protein
MIETECDLSGQEFQPALLKQKLEDIELRNVTNPGDLATVGKYKGKPIPYGSCTVVTPTGIEPDKRIEWIADFIKKHEKIFRDCGATDFRVQINWTGIQGNMELKATELEKLADLRIPLNMNYFFIKHE